MGNHLIHLQKVITRLRGFQHLAVKIRKICGRHKWMAPKRSGEGRTDGRGKSRVEGGKTVIDTASLRDNAARGGGGTALKGKTAE